MREVVEKEEDILNERKREREKKEKEEGRQKRWKP